MRCLNTTLFYALFSVRCSGRVVETSGKPEPHDLAGSGVGAILFFLQELEWEPEHFNKIRIDPELESELA